MGHMRMPEVASAGGSEPSRHETARTQSRAEATVWLLRPLATLFYARYWNPVMTAFLPTLYEQEF